MKPTFRTLKCFVIWPVIGAMPARSAGAWPYLAGPRGAVRAVPRGREAIRWDRADVTVWSDSSYVVDAVEKGWVFSWEKKGFAKKANADLWTRFLAVYRRHQVRFVWIRGHNGHPENERCDRLAVAASQGSDLLVDSGYASAEEA